MADVSLFRDANKAVVTSYEYALYKNVVRFKPSMITLPELLLLLCFALLYFASLMCHLYSQEIFM